MKRLLNRKKAGSHPNSKPSSKKSSKPHSKQPSTPPSTQSSTEQPESKPEKPEPKPEKPEPKPEKPESKPEKPEPTETIEEKPAVTQVEGGDQPSKDQDQKPDQQTETPADTAQEEQPPAAQEEKKPPAPPPKADESAKKDDEFYPVILLAAAEYLNERKQKQKEEEEKQRLKEEAEAIIERKKEKKRERKEKAKAEEKKEEPTAPPPLECYTEYTEVTKCIPNFCPDPLQRPKSMGNYPLVTTGIASRPEAAICPPQNDTRPVPLCPVPRAKQCPQPRRPNVCLPPPARERDFRLVVIDGFIWLYHRWLRMNFALKYIIVMLIILWYFNWKLPSFLPRSFPINLFIVLYLDANLSCFKFIPGFLFLLVPLEKTGTFLELVHNIIINAMNDPLPFVILMSVVLLVIYWLMGWPCRRELSGCCYQ